MPAKKKRLSFDERAIKVCRLIYLREGITDDEIRHTYTYSMLKEKHDAELLRNKRLRDERKERK